MDIVNEKIKPLGLFLGLILMIIGVVFIAIPNQIVGFIAMIIGAALLVIGIVRVLIVLINWKALNNQPFLLIIGLAILGTGIYMLINTQATITLIGIVLGVFAILMALDRFFTAFKRKEEIKIMPSILFGVIHLAFGVGLIYASMSMFSLVIVLYGIYFLVAGLMIVLSLLFYKDF